MSLTDSDWKQAYDAEHERLEAAQCALDAMTKRAAGLEAALASNQKARDVFTASRFALIAEYEGLITLIRAKVSLLPSDLRNIPVKPNLHWLRRAALHFHKKEKQP
jgi:hypothetical protein